MNELKTRLAGLLLALSYKEGDFTLTSGKKSDYYFDCKQTALHPEGGYLIGRLFVEMLKNYEVKGVGGMTLGADPLVTGVTVVSHLEGRPMPGFIIRKQAKGHGTDQYLEGLANFSRGDRVVLLEDVCTTGGTLLTAAERVREAGLEIAGVLAVLDREEGGRERLKAAGLELEAIFTRKALLSAGGR
ncbi:MAG: orotate phosphoribosyltransferase [Pseudodesulfovibrio sp.]|uniref:Orotate phosphoribosyltransferase n=1 Tax=Pseudodesulfovibrio aespoeensis (strain ATCC 700646 / DSM 10631 / Aspo-2) TaxID=643562 RepID=E6VV02_PSEA9|nr:MULTISPECIES: orotate phosphoribosyltransferase [Pseudodesulfovibrio]MBU4191756.1 orotate phosphoribosyltransferase [Pseudomonadota bacterium]ADU63510.1 orotate phosphoribosyltransferase [Pseudodesulfovibrio aespoeensis Aspo-2]MBU4244882.1 orotate phosphoribosyltransferase [Pseudomonadota bacterium]MBU4380087.1 orotate phosphoribosyltransferase [Pseudomonadota bacterium]MBU4475757.1 orotate phosphoribosyltransferase [Pseudomonadota bacterium]